MSRARGCLETAAVMALALVLGGFLTSTWLRHAEGDGPAEGVEAPGAGLTESERGRIRVEVENGSGTPGAAERATEFLRDRGFDVVDFGNADAFDHERTVVVDRSGAPRRAREVAAALRGVPIRTDPDSTLFLDVTVVVGADLDAVLARAEADPAESRPWWRRWLDLVPWVGPGVVP